MSQSAANLQSDHPAEYPYSPRPPTLSISDDVPLRFKFPKPSHVLAVVLCVVFLAGNFAICPVAEFFSSNDWGILWAFALTGGIVAQGGLLSSLLVFEQVPFSRRFVGCWCAAILLWDAWVAGFFVSHLRHGWEYAFAYGNSPEIIQFFALSLPLAALAMQIPLWFLRCYLGWRFCRTDSVQIPPQPLSIRDYLIGTALVALSITCARLAPQPNWDTADYWPNWVNFGAVMAAMSLLGVVPAIYLVLRWRDWRFGFLMLILIGFMGGLLALGVALMFDANLRKNIFKPSGRWSAVEAETFFVSIALFLGLGLTALRALGYSLALGRDPR
jgi:hypothetical protein